MVNSVKKQTSWMYGSTPGSSHQAVLEERDDLQRPADLYLEGSDQYRGWFNSFIIDSSCCNRKSAI